MGFPLRLLVCLLLATTAALDGCAEGSVKPADAQPRADVGSVDRAVVADLGVDLTRDSGADAPPQWDGPVAPDTQPPLDQPLMDQLPMDQLPAADQTPVPDAQSPDLCGSCGPGMTCGSSGCVCDPLGCGGCCAPDGSACLAGTSTSACGSGGATCSACSTSDPCKVASCATGSCVITLSTSPPYPCPGAYGTPCGGSTGQGCYGNPCATFVAGQTGYCSRYCTYDGQCTLGAFSGSVARCNLTAGSQKLCGFECFPGTCPIGTSCNYTSYLCEP